MPQPFSGPPPNEPMPRSRSSGDSKYDPPTSAPMLVSGQGSRPALGGSPFALDANECTRARHGPGSFAHSCSHWTSSFMKSRIDSTEAYSLASWNHAPWPAPKMIMGSPSGRRLKSSKGAHDGIVG